MQITDPKIWQFFWPRLTISSIRLVPHFILVLTMDTKGFVKSDIVRWADALSLTKPRSIFTELVIFAILMTFTPEFRNLFYWRLGLKAKLFSWLCSPLQSLEIAANSIGPGLFIQHGHGTLISADRIGSNCWINQQVTIGYSTKTDRPTIGDNVKIAPGAKIIGNVTIGNNVTVCPNTVVLDDVAAGVTVLGVPARVIWKANDTKSHSVTPLKSGPP